MNNSSVKKLLALALTIVIILSLISCARLFPGKPGTEGPTPSPEPSLSSTEPTPADPSPANSAAGDFLAVEPTVSQLGQYVMQHARELEKEDNDQLLERLLLLQLDASMDMNYKILNDSYMSALNDTMGGILDPTKISDIKNETVRSDFQMLFDGMMTVVRYEESPGIETDWSALNKLKSAFGPQAAFMIAYGSRLQGNYYSDQSAGLDLMAEDIAAIEKQLGKTDTGFVRWKLQHLYARLVSALLYGPEGQYIGDFAAGNKDVLARITKYADTYGSSRFGEICARLLEMRKQDMTLVYDMINNGIVLSPDGPNTLAVSSSQEGGAVLALPALKGGNDDALTREINKTIGDTARSMLLSGKTDQKILCYTTAGGSYLSITFAYSYTDKDGQYGYKEKNLVLDLTTGQSVTLDELAGKPFAAYSDLLRAAMHGMGAPPALKTPLDFALSGSGIMISVTAKDSPYPDYYTVTLNGLRSFMDISKLY